MQRTLSHQIILRNPPTYSSSNPEYRHLGFMVSHASLLVITTIVLSSSNPGVGRGLRVCSLLGLRVWNLPGAINSCVVGQALLRLMGPASGRWTCPPLLSSCA